MTVSWIVVAHRAGARVFKHAGPKQALSLMHELDHTEGRLKSSEIDTDRGGQAFSSHGPGRHQLSKGQSAHEHDAAAFARELATTLRNGRNEQAFGQLVLVAEPHFLGLLRGSLDDATAELVEGTVTKDLAAVAIGDLPGYLGEVLAI